MTTLLAYLSNTEIYISTLISLIHGFGALTVFFGVLLFGEVVIFFSILLSQQGGVELWVVFLASVLGLMTADLFWFLVGRHFPQQRIPTVIRNRVFSPISLFLETYTKDKMFLSLLFFKFFIGTRLAFVLYLSKQDVSLRRFLTYDFFGTFIYITFLSGIGVLLGTIINDVFSVYKTIVSILSAVLFLIFLSYIFRKLYFQSTR